MKDKTNDSRTFAIIGAAMEVHRHLGCGFAEPIYQDALEIEFGLRGLAFLRAGDVTVVYKDRQLKSKYKPDFICFGELIVELKALSTLGGSEDLQVLNYLKATGFKVGLLLNFGNASLEFDRYVWNDKWMPSEHGSMTKCPQITQIYTDLNVGLCWSWNFP